MTERQFPIYPLHELASCFNCGADLDGSYPFDSGNANGRWSQHCTKCDLSTWYDVDDEATVSKPTEHTYIDLTLEMEREEK